VDIHEYQAKDILSGYGVKSLKADWLIALKMPCNAPEKSVDMYGL